MISKSRFWIAVIFTAIMNTNVAFADDKQDVETIVEKLRILMVNPDEAALAGMLSANLSYGHSGGAVEGKDSFVDSLVTGKSDFLAINLTDQIVNVVGNTAIVRHTLNAETHDKGKDPAKFSLKILLVWVKSNNAWQLLARQALRVPT
jgi:hypothetical protein